MGACSIDPGCHHGGHFDSTAEYRRLTGAACPHGMSCGYPSRRLHHPGQGDAQCIEKRVFRVRHNNGGHCRESAFCRKPGNRRSCRIPRRQYSGISLLQPNGHNVALFHQPARPTRHPVPGINAHHAALAMPSACAIRFLHLLRGTAVDNPRGNHDSPPDTRPVPFQLEHRQAPLAFPGKQRE